MLFHVSTPLLFYLTIPPPPRPPLFPYTTLFRSVAADTVDAQARQHLDLALDDAEVLDRKSTRLNSSHRCISYAVFCLKKKKNYNSKASNNVTKRASVRTGATQNYRKVGRRRGPR